MATVVDPPVAPVAPSSAGLARQLLPDLALLALLLALAAPFVVNGHAFTTDEGELLAQLRSLRDHGTWQIDHPAADLDPDGDRLPMPGSPQDGTTFVAAAKHPIYVAALAPVFAVAGIGGVVAVLAAMFVGLALLSAMLARELGVGPPRWAFWAVAGSPLLADAYVAWAFVPGALLTAAAALGVLRVLRRTAGGWLAATGAALALAGAVAVRNEAVLFAVAVGLVALARRRLGPAALWVGAAAASWAASGWWSAQIEGRGARVYRIVDPDAGWLEGRFRGLARILWGMPPDDLGLVAGLVSVAAIVVVSVAVRRDDRRAVVMALGLGLAAPLVYLAGSHLPVPGLLVVAPLVGVGLLCGARLDLDRDRANAVGLVGLHVAAVLATQYADGGGTQWGGRFLHTVLPLALPLAAAAVLGRRRDPEPGVGRPSDGPKDRPVGRRPSVARVALGGLVVLGACWSAASLVMLAEVRGANARMVDAVWARVEATPAGDGGRPVIVGDHTVLGAMSWDRVGDARSLHVTDLDALADTAGDLARAGVVSWTLFTADRDAVGAVAPSYVPSEPTALGSRWLITMQRDPRN